LTDPPPGLPAFPPFTINADLTIDVVWGVLAQDCIVKLYMSHFAIDLDIDLPWWLDALEYTPFVGPFIRAFVTWAKDHYVIDPIYCELLPALTSTIQYYINDTFAKERPGYCICRAEIKKELGKWEISVIACPP